MFFEHLTKLSSLASKMWLLYEKLQNFSSPSERDSDCFKVFEPSKITVRCLKSNNHNSLSFFLLILWVFWSKLYFSTETSSVYFQPNNDLLRHDFHLECLADSIVQCDQIFREVNVEVRTPLLRISVPPQNLSTSVIFLTNFNTYWRLSTSILMWINKSNVYLLIFSNNRVLNGMICFTTVPIKPIKPYY